MLSVYCTLTFKPAMNQILAGFHLHHLSRLPPAVSAGDLMGRATKNLDKLLAMPYGCGEQNMVLFAPNIFILNYLKSTGQLTKEIQDRATRFLESGELSVPSVIDAGYSYMHNIFHFLPLFLLGFYTVD